MVLQDQAAPARPASLKRTLIYVVAFALGALALASGLGFALVGAAHGLLSPTKAASSAKATTPDADGSDDEAPPTRPSTRRPPTALGSKATSRGATEAPAAKDVSRSDEE